MALSPPLGGTRGGGALSGGGPSAGIAAAAAANVTTAVLGGEAAASWRNGPIDARAFRAPRVRGRVFLAGDGDEPSDGATLDEAEPGRAGSPGSAVGGVRPTSGNGGGMGSSECRVSNQW